MLYREKHIHRFGILILVSATIFVLGYFPDWVLKYYSTGLYPYISSSLRFISSWFPFALGDLIYLFLVIYVLYRIYRFFMLIKRKGLKRNAKIALPFQVLNFLLILYLIFKLVWGLNYSRPSISEELHISDEKYTVSELVKLGGFFVKNANAFKALQTTPGVKSNYTIQVLQEKSAAAYKRMESKRSIFRYTHPDLKAVNIPWLTSKAGIEGYYAPLTGEANLNMDLPDFVKPYVSCHEIAHQLGVAYEDEANLLGYLTAVHSPDINYKYSAYYEMLRYILFEIRMKSPDDYKRLHDQLSAGVLADFKTEKEFWRKYNGDMFGYMDATFDRFLKLNNQKKGIDSYQDIVIWLWNIYKRELAVKS